MINYLLKNSASFSCKGCQAPFTFFSQNCPANYYICKLLFYYQEYFSVVIKTIQIFGLKILKPKNLQIQCM